MESNANYLNAFADLLQHILLQGKSQTVINENHDEPLPAHSEQQPKRENTSIVDGITTYTCGGVRYISRQDTARLIGVAPSTLWSWNRTGILTAIKFGNRKVHYRYDDVIALMQGSQR